jgi:hypothetical protein
VKLDRGDNFASLVARQWQAHVYGTPSAAWSDACSQRGLPLHAFDWRSQMADAGFARDAAYVVRPDGYVGLADPRTDGPTLAAYLDARGLRPAASAAAAHV